MDYQINVVKIRRSWRLELFTDSDAEHASVLIHGSKDDIYEVWVKAEESKNTYLKYKKSTVLDAPGEFYEILKLLATACDFRTV